MWYSAFGFQVEITSVLAVRQIGFGRNHLVVFRDFNAVEHGVELLDQLLPILHREAHCILLRWRVDNLEHSVLHLRVQFEKWLAVQSQVHPHAIGSKMVREMIIAYSMDVFGLVFLLRFARDVVQFVAAIRNGMCFSCHYDFSSNLDLRFLVFFLRTQSLTNIRQASTTGLTAASHFSMNAASVKTVLRCSIVR